MCLTQRKYLTVQLGLSEFEDKLTQANWSEVYDADCVNQAWLKFKAIFLSLLDEIAPLKKIRVKQNTEIWMNSFILDLIRKRDMFIQKFATTGKTEYKALYTSYKNKVNYEKKKAKSTYYKETIISNKKNPKQLWKILKQLGSSTKCVTKSQNISLNIEGSLCFDKTKLANHFNTFFSSIAKKLSDSLPSASNMFNSQFITDYYKDKVSNCSFVLHEVSEEIIFKHLSDLNIYKATCLDSIPAKFLLDGARAITRPLTSIVNLSIRTGSVPQEFKSARVVPIYKKKSKTDPGNYRPVSILCIISKIVEKIISDQLFAYLSKNNLLYELQSGFRPSYSTDSCLINLCAYILKENDKGNYSGMIIIDLQKAFDTVQHTILLEKLKAIGMEEIAVQWFQSYLTGREQLVDISDTFSEKCSVECGVPQGSILGPLLFLLYVNDMRAAVKCKLLLYADDSALIVSGEDVSVIEQTLESELESLNKWLIDNRLSPHLGKTELILFGTKRKVGKCKEMNKNKNKTCFIS